MSVSDNTTKPLSAGRETDELTWPVANSATTRADPSPGRSDPPQLASPRGPGSLAAKFTGQDPKWVKPAVWVLMGMTAVLYLWGLSASGWANSYYSAAVQAMADNWTAFFFGSSDMANSITVDKPPASLWVMALSVKVFGLNSLSILVPQALMGVASVGVLYLAVKRWFGGVAGLIAGAGLAATPVAALMFRYNNPDALLVLLLLVAAYTVVRATEKASLKWLVLAGALVGFAFLTKSLQAFLVLPAFFAVYAVAAPTGLGQRIRDLILAFVAMVASFGWWIAVVELWPQGSRPYIGGSEDNSVLNLIFGYNGFGRITGNEPGAVTGGADGAGAAGGSQWGEVGWGRLLDPSWAGGIAWLLPAAFVLLGVGLWLTRREPRTSLLRAGLLLWGAWLLVTWATFSFSSGIIHEYYAIALAPAIAAVSAIGGILLWKMREVTGARWTMAAVLGATAAYATYLLSLAGGAYAVAGWLILVLGLLAGAGLAFGQGRLRNWAIGVGLAALLLGPLLFTVQTAVTAATGSLPTAGPTLEGAQTRGPGGARGGPGDGGSAGADGRPDGAGGQGSPAGVGPGQGLGPDGGVGAPDGAGGAGRGGGPGGLVNSSTPSDELVAALNADSDQFTWVAAAVGSQTAAGYQLGSGNAVMPIGGFNGSDNSPTLAQFQEYVADGEIHWFISGGAGGPGGGAGGPGGGADSASSAISAWVQETFTSSTVDGITLYDLKSDSESSL